MKKKVLLALLPALLVLSACSTGPKKSADLFVEDTLAHEEIFGNVAKDLQVKKLGEEEEQPRSVNSLTKPLVGVQYQPLTNGYYAIRYVAAIAALDVDAVWTRNICESNGTRRKTEESHFPVEKAYTELSVAGGIGLPASLGTDYNYFVVYTLKNIPASDVNSYLFGYLTLTKGEESVTSLARVARVSGGDTFTFDPAVRHGYFLHGNIGGQEFVDIDDNGGSGNWIQEEGIAMNAEDEFGFFKYEPGSGEHFQCFGVYGGGSDYFRTISASNHVKIYHNGSYNIYLSKNGENNNKVYFNGTISAERLYLDATVWKNEGNPRFALYAFTNDKTQNEWFDMSLVSGNVYKVDVDTKYHQVIFCRMNPAQTANDWANKWNQSYDLGIPATNTVNRKYTISNYNDQSACPGDWFAID